MTQRYVTARYVRELADRLSERDWLVLKHVSSLRFVSGAQLTRLCFTDGLNPAANGRAARRALSRLIGLTLLERLPRTIGGVRAGSAGYVYRLGIGGYRLAVMRGWQPARRRRRSLTPGTLFLRHTLLIAELHTRLIERERAGACELLTLHAEPSCWRDMDGLGTQRLKPDSYVRLGIGPYEDSYFIEVDRGTEGSRAIAAQLERYVAHFESGQEQRAHGVFPKVLWLTTTTARRAVIEDCVQRLSSESHGLFQVARFDHALQRMQLAPSTREGSEA